MKFNLCWDLRRIPLNYSSIGLFLNSIIVEYSIKILNMKMNGSSMKIRNIITYSICLLDEQHVTEFHYSNN